MAKTPALFSGLSILLLLFWPPAAISAQSMAPLALSDLEMAKAKGLLIWDGEAAEMRTPSNFAYAVPNGTQAYEGSWCMEGMPDTWHQPSISLSGQAIYRGDISSYDELWLFAKTDRPGVTLHFSVVGWPYTSNEVNIAPYVPGGSLDTTYKLVKIPIAQLKTAQYSLNVIESLSFGTAQVASPAYTIYVDAVYAVDLTPTRVTQVQLLSDKTIKLTVKDRYDPAGVLNLANYSVTGTGDPDYAAPRHPIRVGRHYWVRDFAPNGVAPIISFELFLVFDTPLKNGNTYLLSIANVPDTKGNDFSAPQTAPIPFDDANLISGSVKASQVGYLPSAPKVGYLGNYLGDAGMLELSPSRFELRNAEAGTLAFEGTPRFRGDDLALSGERVFECDFSALNAPGRYYLYVPGLGRTYDFSIGTDVYNAVARKMSRLYYYQRAGLALAPAFAGPWARGAGHLATDAMAAIHPVHALSPLYNGEVIGSTRDMRRGWYDAGDYGKYMLTAAPTVFHLFTAYELFPQRFTDNQLNIPESGNGVPDLLDELKWEMDWVKEMQAGDGGVFDRLVTVQWATSMPEFDLATRYIAPKTTHVTANYAAMLAMAYRNFLPFWPDYSNDLLARAEWAWAFLEAHPAAQPPDGITDYVGGGGYIDPSDSPASDVDNRAWAAAELYKSTGKATYAAAFETYGSQHAPTWGWNEYQHHQKKAFWAYATTRSFPVNAGAVNSYKAAVQFSADQLVWETQNNVYRNACRTDVPAWIGWGAFAQSSRYSWELIRAAYLLQDTSYLAWAALNLDTQLGNNPQYKSYITGVGTDSPRDPLHKQSQYDAVAEPVPGIPVYGPHSHLTNGNPYNLSAQSTANLYPSGYDTTSPYPLLRRYFDTHELVEMSEFAINDTALDLPAYVFLSAPNVAPVAYAQGLMTAKNTALTILLAATDADGESAALRYSVLAPPTHGMLSGTPPDLVYIPNTEYVGTDSFTFKARDGAADSAVATVSITLLNQAPALAASPLAVPNPALPGQVVDFLATASDPDGDVLTYTWDFGDGALGSGSHAAHSYAAPGSYRVSVTVADVNGALALGTLGVTVLPAEGGGGATPDSSGSNDPYDDEVMAGTLSGAPPLETNFPLAVKKLAGRLRFNATGRDACMVEGSFIRPFGFAAAGSAVELDIGGVRENFTLDWKGRAKTIHCRFSLRRHATEAGLTETVSGSVVFKTALRNGSYAEAWADEGLIPAAGGQLSALVMGVGLKVQGLTYRAEVPIVCSTKSGIGAKFKRHPTAP